MYTTTPVIERIFCVFCGLVLVVPAIFFAYYTMRLIYINIAFDDAAAHRTGGMLIGVVAFPVATILSGWASWILIRRGTRGKRLK